MYLKINIDIISNGIKLWEVLNSSVGCVFDFGEKT